MRPVDAMVPPVRGDVPRSAGEPGPDAADGVFADTLRTLFHRSESATGGDSSASIFNRDGLLGGGVAEGAFPDPSLPTLDAARATVPRPPVAPSVSDGPPEAPRDDAPVVGARAEGPLDRGTTRQTRPPASVRAHHAASLLPAPVIGVVRGGPSQALSQPEPVPVPHAPRPAAAAAATAAATRRPPVDLLVQLGVGAATLSVRLDGAEPDAEVLMPEVAALLARHGLVLDELRINGRPAGGGPQQRG